MALAWRGAVAGMVPWLWYGLFEQLAVFILRPEASYTIRHWLFSLFLLVVYAAAGSCLGIAAAIARPVAKAVRLPSLDVLGDRSWATIGLAAVYTIGLLKRYGWAPTGQVLLVATALLLAFLLARRRSKGGAELDPWFVPLILISSAALLLDPPVVHKTWQQVGIVAAGVCIAAALGAVWSRWQSGRRSTDAPALSPFASARVVGIWAFLAIAGTYTLVVPSPRLEPLGKTSGPDRRPNVIMVILDTVRAESMSLYGYGRDTTPFLRTLSETGTLFQHAIATGDITLTTHASAFTGLYGRTHGAHYGDDGTGRPLRDDFYTLSERLSDAGYLTAGIAANHVFFGAGYGLEQGFDYFDARPPAEYVLLHRLGHVPRYLLRQYIHRVLTRLVNEKHLERHYRSAEQITSEAIDVLTRISEDGVPFFLFLNYMDAHWPYVPPAPFDTRWPGKDATFDGVWHYDLLREVVSRQTRHIKREEREHLLSQYDGGIAYIDSELERFFGRLKESVLGNNTMIIITSDHGESFGEHDLVDHGVGVYEEQVHVPLLIIYPWDQERKNEEKTVSLVDLLPTVLDTVGLPVPKDIQGRSLGKRTRGRVAVVSESFPNVAFLGSRFQRVERALWSGRFKLISSNAGKSELFDLMEDPKEQANLRFSHQGIATELEEQLAGWLDEVQSAHELAPALDHLDNLERLRALGYIQ